jgi:hypothetical protein
MSGARRQPMGTVRKALGQIRPDAASANWQSSRALA